MNLLDYALILVVAISVVAAAMRGFVYEVWMMAAAVVAIGLAFWQYSRFAPWFHFLGTDAAANFAAFAAVLIVVLLVAAITGRIVRRLLRAVGLGGVDRVLGAGLGLARGFVLGVALIFMMTAFPFNRNLLLGSRLAPGFEWGSRALARMVPSDLEARFELEWKNDLRELR